MHVHETFDLMVGHWTGVNLLRILPTDPYQESEARVTVTRTARGNFLTLAYTWADQGEPQDGLLLIGAGDGPDTAVATWVDSWHQSTQWMVLKGKVNDVGAIQLTGSYADDAWGWRINVGHTDGSHLRLTMDNVPPGHGGYQAVQATFASTG